MTQQQYENAIREIQQESLTTTIHSGSFMIGYVFALMSIVIAGAIFVWGSEWVKNKK